MLISIFMVVLKRYQRQVDGDSWIYRYPLKRKSVLFCSDCSKSCLYCSKLSRQAHKELVTEFGPKILPPNHPITRQVHQVVANLLESSDLGTLREPWEDVAGIQQPHVSLDPFENSGAKPRTSNTKWTLFVVDDPKTINAMATFGHIIVFTGILPIAQDTSGLAAILGHEIAHAILRHPSERLSSNKVYTALGFLLSALGFDLSIAQPAMTVALE